MQKLLKIWKLGVLNKTLWKMDRKTHKTSMFDYMKVKLQHTYTLNDHSITKDCIMLVFYWAEAG